VSVEVERKCSGLKNPPSDALRNFCGSLSIGCDLQGG